MKREYDRRIGCLILLGWEYSKASLYDDEGIEGWLWVNDDNLEEYAEIGEWDEPPEIPETLIDIADKYIKANND